MTKYTTNQLVSKPSAIPSRNLYDKLLTAINSGLYPYFTTLRHPTASPAKGSPRYNPEHQKKVGRKIAESLAAQGIASVLAGTFQSVNTQKQNPHFHGLLSRQPSIAWSEAFKVEYGRRAFHLEFIGLKPKDPARLAAYIAKQAVTLTAAGPQALFTLSATIMGG